MIVPSSALPMIASSVDSTMAESWSTRDRVPSGQVVARELGRLLEEGSIPVRVLSDEEMLPTEACVRRYTYHAGKLRKALENNSEFLTETPLSYYVLQEASVLGVACYTLAHRAESVVTLTYGTNVLLGDDPEEIAHLQVAGMRRTPIGIPLWDGRSGERVAAAIGEYLHSN